METFRKITVKFKTESALNEFSQKILSNTDYKLLPNMKEVQIGKDGIDFAYKKSLKAKPKKPKQWEQHWKDLTPFEINDKAPFAHIDFLFNDSYDNDALSDLLDQTVTVKTKSLFYPKKIVGDENYIRVLGERGNPQYPIYVISKGRSKTCVTADHLIKMEVPFKIVIEKQEWNDYAEVYGEDRLLELDLSFRDEYDVYIKDFPADKSKGSGPARNFVWWHAKNVVKSDWHWIMDDNIFGFNYYNDHRRMKAVDGTIFAAAEDFVNRYDNIGISGLNYYMFAIPGSKEVPYVANTKIYSCLLINNHIPIRWAGRYNEDVDICIRALKEGYSTIQFDAFLAKKGGTQTMGGGNTDAFYAEEGTLPKSNMLMFNHPDITNVTWRFQRWHHVTNYDIFDVYKDRTIGETIEYMMQPPVLDREADKDIIEQIRNIDFKWIERWNIFKELPEEKRTRLLDTLKFYRFTKDNERIIDILCQPRVLNCDYYDHIWEHEVPDTEDNRIMKDLLALADDNGMLFYTVDWDDYLSYVEPEKRATIVHEMKRNKYLQKKDYTKYNYNIQEFLLSTDEHFEHHDSKAQIINKYVNQNDDLEVPVTFFDKKIRGDVKLERKKTFESKLTSRSEKIVKKDESYTVMIHGTETFDDQELFDEKIGSVIPEQTEEIINSVYYPVDLFGANYALTNKLKNKDFVPDEIMYTDGAYRKIYTDMSEYANELILFIDGELTDDLTYLVNEFENQNKPVTVIKGNTTNTTTLDDWD
jgi:hypothetical protein